MSELTKVIAELKSELRAEKEAHGKTQLALQEAEAQKEAFGHKAHQLQEKLDAIAKICSPPTHT